MTTTRRIVSCLHRRTSTLASTTSHHHVNSVPETEMAKPFKEMPGPTGFRNLPFIGMALNFKPFTEFGPFQLTEVLTMLRNRYGDIFKVRMGNDMTVNICHPEIAEELLRLPSKENERVVLAIAETMYKRNNIKARALSQLNGLEWRTTRKLVQQKLMKPRCLNVFFPSINWSSDNLIETLQKQDKVNDMLYQLQNYSADSIGMVTLNKDLGCLRHTSTIDLPAVIDPILKCIHETFFLPLNTYKYLRTKLYNEFETNFLALYNYVLSLTQEQKALVEKIIDQGRIAEHLENNYNVFHDLLVEGKLSAEKINATIFDFFVGGINSTSSLMLFLLIDLANNPEKQNVLYQEITDVVGDKSEITKEDYDRLSYLKACVKESHRMRYPGFLGMVRFMEADATIAGYTIPKNTKVLVLNEMMCSDERFFPKPHEYIPERWMREESDDQIAKGYSIHPFIVKPFGYGARSCTGQRIAEILMMVGIAKIIKRFNVTLPNDNKDIEWTRRVFPVPTKKVEMCLTPRQS